MEEQIDYASSARNSGNSHEGHSKKRLKGDLEKSKPQDRKGSFEPQLVKKGQTRFTAFAEQPLVLYA